MSGKKTTAKPTLTDEVLEALRDLLHPQLVPAAAGGAAEYMSTQQLWSIVDAHSPGLIDIRLMREALLALGYAEKLVGGAYCWVIAQR